MPSVGTAGRARHAAVPGSRSSARGAVTVPGEHPPSALLCFPEGSGAGHAGAGASVRLCPLPSGSALFFWRRAPAPRQQLSPGERLGGQPPLQWEQTPPEMPRTHGKGGPPSPSRHPPSPRHTPGELSMSGRREEEEGPFPSGPLSQRCAPRGRPQVPTAPQEEPPPAAGKVAHVGRAWPPAPRTHLRHPYTSTHVCTHATSHRDE